MFETNNFGWPLSLGPLPDLVYLQLTQWEGTRHTSHIPPATFKQPQTETARQLLNVRNKDDLKIMTQLFDVLIKLIIFYHKTDVTNWIHHLLSTQFLYVHFSTSAQSCSVWQIGAQKWIRLNIKTWNMNDFLMKLRIYNHIRIDLN